MDKKTYIKYFSYLILSLVLTTIGAYGGSILGVAFFYEIGVYTTFILSIAILLLLFFSTDLFKKIMFVLFCVLEGLLLTPMVLNYTEVSLFNCFLITTLITIVFMIVGYKIRNLSFLRRTLFNCLIIVLIYCLFTIFISLPSMSFLFILLFMGYIAYDMNKFKLAIEEGLIKKDDDILMHVINMYLNIINLFVAILDSY